MAAGARLVVAAACRRRTGRRRIKVAGGFAEEMDPPLVMPSMRREPIGGEFLPNGRQYDNECSPDSFYTVHSVGWPWALVCLPCLAAECAMKGVCCLTRAQGVV